MIQPDYESGMSWARVKFELDQLGSGDPYDQPRPTPPTKPGAACETAEWGTGVNAVRQADAVPADPTSPGILYAPLVEETGPARAEGPGGPSTTAAAPAPPHGDRPPLPATGGGLALLAVSATAGSLVISRRR